MTREGRSTRPTITPGRARSGSILRETVIFGADSTSTRLNQGEGPEVDSGCVTDCPNKVVAQGRYFDSSERMLSEEVAARETGRPDDDYLFAVYLLEGQLCLSVPVNGSSESIDREQNRGIAVVDVPTRVEEMSSSHQSFLYNSHCLYSFRARRSGLARGHGDGMTGALDECTAHDLATEDVATLTADEVVSAAIGWFTERGYDAAPVVEEEQPIGHVEIDTLQDASGDETVREHARPITLEETISADATFRETLEAL